MVACLPAQQCSWQQPMGPPLGNKDLCEASTEQSLGRARASACRPLFSRSQPMSKLDCPHRSMGVATLTVVPLAWQPLARCT
eukprot:2268653-Amphidinium_carterae.1